MKSQDMKDKQNIVTIDVLSCCVKSSMQIKTSKDNQYPYLSFLCADKNCLLFSSFGLTNGLTKNSDFHSVNKVLCDVENSFSKPALINNCVG